MPIACVDCALFTPSRSEPENHGVCHLEPTDAPVKTSYWCSHFRREWYPGDELARTSVDVLFSAHTLIVLRRAKISTVQDLVDLGRCSVRTNGSLDRDAITEIEKKLSELGVRW